MSWFEMQDARWRKVSGRLAPARVVAVLAYMAIPLAGTAAAGAINGGGWWTPFWVAIGITVMAMWVGVRHARVHAWAERDEDLMVRRGVLMRVVTVVPYGRMQFVDVQAGPIARMFGLARVQLHTASPGTDAAIFGVPASEAERLRDRLTARGESRLAGL